MPDKTRALAVALILLLTAVGCSRASKGQRVSQAPPAPPPAATTTPTTVTDTTPIPGHPPVTTSGVVAKVDPQAGVLVFQDGRTVKLTEQSKLLSPVDISALVPGTRVVVRNAMPVGVSSAKAAGKRQKVGTVAVVDQQNQAVRLTDGSVVAVKPSTNMHMGTQGRVALLTDLRPGDEVIIVLSDKPPVAGAAPAVVVPAPSGAGGSSTDPSALPRAAISGSPGDPGDADEVMIFREQQAP